MPFHDIFKVFYKFDWVLPGTFYYQEIYWDEMERLGREYGDGTDYD